MSLHPNKESIKVILTDKPISDFAVLSLGERVIPSHKGKLKSVELTINPEKKIDSVMILNAGIFTNCSGILPDDIAEITTFNEDRIEGKVFLKKNRDVGGRSLTYEAGFKADIRRKLNKKPSTEADMKKAAASPQAAAFTAFKEAIYAGDVNKVIPLVTADTVEMLSSERGPQMVQSMQKILPTDTKFLRVTVTGETAVLETSGKEDGQPVNAVIDLLNEGSSWKFRKLSVKPIN